MSTQFDKLEKCYEYCKTVTDFIPRVGLILGSGLGGYAKNMKVVKEISYDQIPGFPVSTVQGHDGKFLLGYIGKVPAMVMKGRVHFYEGYTPQEVVLPVRLMKRMGIEILFLTNASGGINRDFQVGDFMMITDHITTGIPSPLIGPNADELGTRFPDMSEVYSNRLQDVIRNCAKGCDIELQEGVYVQFSGPNYETPAEVKLAQIWGGDAVGMSTACEAMAARHMGMEICGISCITNMAAGISKGELNHKEVQETADKVAKSFKELVAKVVVNM